MTKPQPIASSERRSASARVSSPVKAESCFCGTSRPSALNIAGFTSAAVSADAGTGANRMSWNVKNTARPQAAVLFIFSNVSLSIVLYIASPSPGLSCRGAISRGHLNILYHLSADVSAVFYDASRYIFVTETCGDFMSAVIFHVTGSPHIGHGLPRLRKRLLARSPPL